MRSWFKQATSSDSSEQRIEGTESGVSSGATFGNFFRRQSSVDEVASSSESRSVVRSSRSIMGSIVENDGSTRILQTGMDPRKVQQNVEIERNVTQSARRLGTNIESIVLAAQGKEKLSDNSWKDQLLDLFGGSDEKFAKEEIKQRLLKTEIADNANLDVNILLKCSSCDKFVERSIENELPPRLIHCLRLFRLIELGRTSEYWSEMQYSNSEEQSNEDFLLKPISTKAVSKVETLLTLLCTNISLGEQLRPHLFGLLALSDHAYPKNGSHIAKAASAIVCRFAENCLSPSLVWFLHANKMIINMTDDVKELIGMTSSASVETTVSPRSMCLYGKAAENDGMWICALSAVVAVVTNSCRHQTVKLLHDFDSAGGYYVISHAIINSSRSNMSKLLELAIQLACCKSEESPPSPINRSQSIDDETFLVKNIEGFRAILFDLASRSIPFLVDYVDRKHGDSPNFLKMDFIQNASVDSVQTALARDLVLSCKNNLPSFEIASEILMTMLQVYTSHPKNFGIIESSFFMLSMFLVAFPSFKDDSTKVCILKTLEYVCTTGLVDISTTAPVSVACEIFYALCVNLLGYETINNSSYTKDKMINDAESLCDTLEKAIQVDEFTCKVLFECGFLDHKLSDFLRLVAASKRETEVNESLLSCGYPNIEEPYLFMCRILRLIATKNHARLARSSAVRTENGRINLNILLTTAVTDLSEKSSRAALSVFQEVMCVSPETLDDDVTCLLDLIGVLINYFGSDNCEKKAQAIVRQTDIFNVVAVAMRSNEHVHPAFLKCNGFGVLLEVTQSLKGVFFDSSTEKENNEYIVLLKFVETIFSVIGAAFTFSTTIGMNSDLFYSTLARAVAETGILEVPDFASRVLNLTLALMDPSLSLSWNLQELKSLKNAEAAKLVLSITTLLPTEQSTLAKNVIEIMLEICTNLSFRGILAQSSIVKGLTSTPELLNVISNRSHPLHSSLLELLAKIASFSMTSDCFISFLRCIGLPILRDDKHGEKVVLPVIVSSLQASKTSGYDKYREENDSLFCEYLEIALKIAVNEELVPRYLLGGGSIDKLSFYMQDVPIEERMYQLAKDGALSFVEIPSISKRTGSNHLSVATSDERLWNPSTMTGFSFSTWLRLSKNISKGYRSENTGCIFLLDLHTSPNSNENHEHLTIWYDLTTNQVNVSTTQNACKKPESFPPMILRPDLWNHVLITYSLPKRSLLGKRVHLNLYVNGESIGEVKIDQVNIPLSGRCLIGCCNPKLLESAKKYLRGPLPPFELGQATLMGTVLSAMDASSIFLAGPDFDGVFWGDNPQRNSLRAIASCALSRINEIDSSQTINDALRLRKLQLLQNSNTLPNSLDLGRLNCNVSPNEIVFCLRANAISRLKKNAKSVCEVKNISSLSSMASSDAIIVGEATIIAPNSFSENLRWIGGPSILFPLINSVQTSKSLSLILQLVRAGSQNHVPNLQVLKLEGGFSTLAHLLYQKGDILGEENLDVCFSFCVEGFETSCHFEDHELENRWLITDLDALKYLVLNGQVWKYRTRRDLSVRLLSHLNKLVSPHCLHAPFNAKNLHYCGIVKWVMHLMFESVGLFDSLKEYDSKRSEWKITTPKIVDVCNGDYEGDNFLRLCQVFLSRTFKHWLALHDLIALTDGITTSLTPGQGTKSTEDFDNASTILDDSEFLSPSCLMRIYLLEMLQELVVDSVRQFVAVIKGESVDEDLEISQPNQSTSSKLLSQGRKAAEYIARKPASEESIKEENAEHRVSLPTFTDTLSPQWFASILETCSDEASVGAILRLLVLSLQASHFFTEAFKQYGGFSQFTSSIPRFSTSPSVIISLVAHLVDFPVPQIPMLSSLDENSLCDIFEHEPDENPTPPPDVFLIISECMVRNVQLSSRDDGEGERARNANFALITFIGFHYKHYHFFKLFCHTDGFLHPLMQIFFALHKEKSRIEREVREVNMIGESAEDSSQSTAPVDNNCSTYFQSSEQSLPNEGDDFMSWPSNSVSRIMANPMRSSILNSGDNALPTELFLGQCTKGIGALLLQLLHVILSDAVFYRPRAAAVLLTLFKAFPSSASHEEVELYQLMLVERSRIIIDDALLRGGPIALANCAGFASVLLDRLVGGFFRAETVMLSVKGCINTLKALTSSRAHSALGQSDQNSLVVDMLYISRLVCVVGLQKMRPGPFVDDHLSFLVIDAIAKNAKLLLLNAMSSVGKSSFLTGPSSAYVPPPSSSQKYHIWQSASVVRGNDDCKYPDLTTLENPDRAFVVALMSELQHFLSLDQTVTREPAVLIIIALLRQRKPMMSEMLTQEISFTNAKGENRKETVDLFQRGGFGALLLAHESAHIAENVSTVTGRRQRQKGSSGGKSVGVLKYASFFDWYRKNIQQVDGVFYQIHLDAKRQFPTFYKSASENVIDTICREQKSYEDSMDYVFMSGIELLDATQDARDRTKLYHGVWIQRGFDDIAYGAMKWKILLRKLKGPLSVWERSTSEVKVSNEEYNTNMRWKLDLAEGHERQRRMLVPNYEFHGLYSIDEDNFTEVTAQSEKDSKNFSSQQEVNLDSVSALLKEMQLKTGTTAINTATLFDEEDENQIFDSRSDIDAGETGTEGNQPNSDTLDQNTLSETVDSKEDVENEDLNEDMNDAEQNDEVRTARSNTEFESNVVFGMLEDGEYPKKAYNISRCTGLEVKKGLLLFCRNSIYVIDGFELAEGDNLHGKINRVESSLSTYQVNIKGTLRQQEPKTNSTDTSVSSSNIRRCQRISHDDLYSAYKRRYQLQDVAVEIFDVHRSSILVAFSSISHRDEFLANLLKSHLPNSIFESFGGLTSTSYNKIMTSYQAKVTNNWVNGKMSNFDFLMHINMFAGRTYNDLTQYPVFPWVLQDYDKEEINLNDPSIYRDLSKPMGAQGKARARLFQERFDELEACYEADPHSNPPPFHYGTHYSCAAYVLYYLMRLEPFSRLALQLQGGKFDVPDRLFRDIGNSWKSAAYDNFQDVRELIPEFFYLPDFLINSNSFDFGVTQAGTIVDDVRLPKWAKGDPKRFVRLHRMALESKYVTMNLHRWIDLVFGYKQRGPEARASLNIFVHLTYDGHVDLDAIEDPIERESTITQIQNFGQTPSRIERKPFPKRTILSSLRGNNIDFSTLPLLLHSTPPLCIVGAPHRVYLKVKSWTTCKTGVDGQVDSSVGDIDYCKGQIISVGKTCAIVRPKMLYIRYGGYNNGVSVHVGVTTSRLGSVNTMISCHDSLHGSQIKVAKVSRNGRWLVTGCADSTVRVWRIPSHSKLKSTFQLQATLCGHAGGKITCVDVNTRFGIIVTGGSDGAVLLWDLRTTNFLRQLQFDEDARISLFSGESCAASSVSVNSCNGNILVLVGCNLYMFDINGSIIASYSQHDWVERNTNPTYAVSTDCPEWMEDGIAAVTGHKNGDVRVWSLDYNTSKFVMRQLIPDKVHSCPITSLTVCGEAQDILLVGDASGKVSETRSIKLDTLNSKELEAISAELLSNKSYNQEGSSNQSDDDFTLL